MRININIDLAADIQKFAKKILISLQTSNDTCASTPNMIPDTYIYIYVYKNIYIYIFSCYLVRGAELWYILIRRRRRRCDVTSSAKSGDFRWEVWTILKIGDECIEVGEGHCHPSAAKSLLFSQMFGCLQRNQYFFLRISNVLCFLTFFGPKTEIATSAPSAPSASAAKSRFIFILMLSRQRSWALIYINSMFITSSAKSNDFWWEVWTILKIGDECIEVGEGHCHPSAAKSLLFFRFLNVCSEINADFSKFRMS